MRLLATVAFALLSLAHLGSALTYKGADISSIPVVERNGIRYTDNGSQKPLETILKSHGMNLARIRVWTAGDYNLANSLSLAKRIKAAGLTLMVDLHYSDTWADPGHQSIPSGWPSDLSGLNTKIYQYTADVVKQFSNQGTPIDILQVGNEINDGFLWPVGRISTNGFAGASQLLHSAVNGARSSGSPKIAVHLADGWKWDTQSWFWKGIFRQGEFATSDIDMIGVSFYPFYNSQATLANLRSSLSQLTSLTGKPIYVAETNWPAKCSSVTLSEPSIPKSAAGQETWIKDIKSVLDGLNGRGLGILYWEPAWIGNAGLGSACEDNLVVESNGAVRSSMNIFNDM